MTARDEVRRVLAAVEQWARRQLDVDAVALVGSWARNEADSASDIDFVVLTHEPAPYLSDDSWIESASGAPAKSMRTAHWGVVTERRVALASGVEVDYGFATPEWAAVHPVDDGTARVVLDGLVAVYDPEGLLARLVRTLNATEVQSSWDAV